MQVASSKAILHRFSPNPAVMYYCSMQQQRVVAHSQCDVRVWCLSFVKNLNALLGIAPKMHESIWQQVIRGLTYAVQFKNTLPSSSFILQA